MFILCPLSHNYCLCLWPVRPTAVHRPAFSLVQLSLRIIYPGLLCNSTLLGLCVGPHKIKGEKALIWSLFSIRSKRWLSFLYIYPFLWPKTYFRLPKLRHFSFGYIIFITRVILLLCLLINSYITSFQFLHIFIVHIVEILCYFHNIVSLYLFLIYNIAGENRIAKVLKCFIC